jgi:alpha-beta hydrolase superfamily lysophospholipase
MNKRKFIRILRWLGWIFIIQFVLLNISAAFYASKFTHLHTPEEREVMMKNPPSQNFFAKTWRLFTGYRFYKEPQQNLPDFPYTIVNWSTPGNILIEAWYSRVDSVAKGTVILFHGLMGNKSFVIDQAREFRKRGYNVLMPDTRGHGNSSGNSTCYGYDETEEVKLAYDYVKIQGEQNIYFWGISMGAVEIMKAVSDYNLSAKGLILQMPFGSLQSHVKSRLRNMGLPGQPFGFLITFWMGFENGFNGLGFQIPKYARSIHCPVLLQYGAKDQLVSRKEIDEIYNAIPSIDKKLVIYNNARHESLLQHDPVRWNKEIDEFLGIR